jgi:hypothetical protein
LRSSFRTGLFTLLKVLAGSYFLLTSVYCLLAYLPYTYTDVIKAPPYAWMPWFAEWHVLLYWIMLLSLAIVSWKQEAKIRFFITFGLLTLAGIVVWHHFLANIQNNESAFLWAVASLAPLILVAAENILSNSFWTIKDETAGFLFEYGTAIKAGVLVALLYVSSTMLQRYLVSRSFALFNPAYDSELVCWSLLSHITIALIVLSVLNLIRIVAAKTIHPRPLRLVILGFCITGFLWWGLARFFANSLSFEGWQAQFYAVLFSFTLVLFGVFIVSGFLEVHPTLDKKKRTLLLAGLCLGMTVIAFVFPFVMVGADWNGMFETTFTLSLWAVFAVSFYMLRPQRRVYSLAAVLGVLIFTVFTYKGLQASELYWSKPLGLTDDTISRALDLYATRDSSFDLARHLLERGEAQHCGDLCHVLRQYANIRNPLVKDDLKLVNEFVPNRGPRPNIFIFVIDSLRPDYLGPYNQKVDFTPNLDKFASDSIVVRNVYTQYAGTSLSEPAIWSGSLLLHAHYQQPFHKLNSLEKLAEGDGYQIIVSWDEIVRQILASPPDLIKLDTDKPLWNNLEACSTIQQLESVLDNRADRTRPIFFYAQPKNVHQFARNDLPKRTSENWRLRQGFNNRIAYEVNQVDSCMGGFFHYLHAANLYDNSIVIFTADHGDATGEFGRLAHSTIIYPEVMRVPLIIHLPESIKKGVVYDNSRISTLTDIAPSLYYLLGHQSIVHNPLFGRPLFMGTEEELQSYERDDVFFASDARAAFGLLTDHGRFFYATYDSPPRSKLFDLEKDPLGIQDILTPDLKKQYDREVIEHLHTIADFYGYKPGVRSLLALTH